jgi:site-specific recombinase XerD
MNNYPFKYAILNDQGLDLNKRWSITFWVYDVDLCKKVRKFDYSVNDYKSVRERKAYAKKRIETINDLLKRGFHLDKKKQIETSILTVADGLEFALNASSINHVSKLSYKSVVKLFLEWANKQGIDKQLIQHFEVKHAYQYRDYLKVNGKAGVTINSDISCLKRMWNILFKRELIKSNPWTKIEKEKEIITNRNIAFTWTEVTKLSGLVSVQDPELWKFISIIYHTLARPTEIRQLQVYNVHLSKRKIYFDAWKTKSKKERWINIHDSLMDTIIDLISCKSSNEFLFPGRDIGKPISKNKMTDRQRKYLKKLSLYDGDHTLYSWKHTGVVEAYEAGVDLKSIQRQCGHASITQTDSYLKSLGLYNNHEIIIKQPPLPL